MEDNKRKLNLSISDGMDFFAHEVTINFNPTQMIMDFKCITPRADPRSSEGPVMSIKHNVVLLDIYHAKRFYDLMGDIIKRYEKDFGKIQKPKSLEKAEKKKGSAEKEAKEKKDKATVPSYFG